MDILNSDSLSRNVTFNCLMFMPEISNRMVFVNGKHPSFNADKVGKLKVGKNLGLGKIQYFYIDKLLNLLTNCSEIILEV